MLRHLRSDRVRVAVAPQHGFTIASIELATGDGNILWNPPGASFAPLPADDLGPPGSASIEYFDRRILAGGWFPMFPTAGLPGMSTQRWMHGEVPRISWQVVEESETHLTASVDTPASRIRVHRTVRVIDSTVTISTHAKNLGEQTQQITIGEHPCFDRTVFEAGTIEVTPQRARVTSVADPKNAVLCGDVEFTWPNAPRADTGTLDLSVIPATPDGRHDHVGLVGVATAQIRGHKHIVTLAWDRHRMSFALLWEHFTPTGSPWRGDVFAIEAMSSPGRTFDDAITARATIDLTPTQTLTTWMSITVTPAAQ